MALESPSQSWFEMADLRRRRFAATARVPLRAAEKIVSQGEFGQLGWKEEFFLANSVAFAPEKRSEAERLDFHSFDHTGGPYAYRSGTYKPCEVYQRNDEEDLGVDFVFEQYVGNGHPRLWHLSQDLVIALRLLQEGDQWIRPDEDYAVVVRQRRDTEGSIVAIEVRSDCLRDYLSARGLALRLHYYRSRTSVMADTSHLSWPKEGLSEGKQDDRYEARVWEVDENGRTYGAGVAVYTMWRTDVDPEEDVPVYGGENDSNTDGTSQTFQHGGVKHFRVQGEMWRAEWIDSADRSEHVRGDAPAEQITLIVDVKGERWPTSSLYDQDIGRYVWFDPRVIPALLQKRGGGLIWYSQATGGVWSLPDYRVHFGINRVGLITVYAYDIARLPIWQQRTWASYNVVPDGAVSEELLDAQMRTRPAGTWAPEAAIPELMDRLDALFHHWLGAPLFKYHHATPVVLKTVHRFRALEQNGILALAKDLARLIVDRIDITSLHTVCAPPKGQKWGSLKSLENALCSLIPPDQARSLLTPFVGIYELRLGDAHLPSSTIDKVYETIGIDRSKHAVDQGLQILGHAANALSDIGIATSEVLKKRGRL